MKIVLAYSGGLDTSVLLKQFVEQGHQVVAMTANLGESDMVAGDGSQDALEAARRKALMLGAVDAVLVDARERFVEEYAFKALAGNALYQGVYPLVRGALAAADRRPAGRDGGRARRRRGRPRLHRQGQRPGPHRGRRACQGPAPQDAGAAARQAALAPRRDRLRASARRADRPHRGQAVLRRRQPVGPLDRGGRAGEPLERAARRRLRLDRRPGDGALRAAAKW